MWKYLTTINWNRIGKFHTFEIFPYSTHAQIQNTVKMLKNEEKNIKMCKQTATNVI